MNALPTSGIWLQAVGLLAVQSAVLLLAAGLAQGRTRAPQTRRRVWLAALAALALLLANSLSGFDRYLARQLAAESSSGPTFVVRSNLPTFPPDTAVTASDSSPEPAVPVGAIPSSDTPAITAGVIWPAWLWLAGVVVAGGGALVPRLWLAWACRRATSVESPDFEQRLHRLATQLRIRGRVRVVRLTRLTTPVAFGVLQPTVGLPADSWTAHSPAEQDAMLAHELAHLAVRDPLWLGLADLMAVLLWWHPLVWWARRQFRAASETAADEASLLVDDGPAVLAGCLVALASRWQQRGVLGLLGMAGFRSDLGRRVERLLHLRNGGLPSARRRWPGLVASLGAVVVLATIVAVSAWLVPAQAGARPTLLAVVGDALVQGAAKQDPALSTKDPQSVGERIAGGAAVGLHFDSTNSWATVAVRVPPTNGLDVTTARVAAMDAVTRRLQMMDLFSEVRCEPFDTDRFHVRMTLKRNRSQQELPGTAVRRLITQSGQIQFRRVHPETASLIAAGRCPADCEVLTQHLAGAVTTQQFVVFRQAEANLTSANLKEVRAKRHEAYGEPCVALSFDDAGKKAFAQLTRASIGRQIAVVLEGVVLTAPRVMQEIPAGTCEVSGVGSEADARAMAAALTCPLPWKLTIETEDAALSTSDSLPEVKSAGTLATSVSEPTRIASVSIDEDGRLTLDQREQTLESIQSELRRLLSDSSTLVVRLAAPETVQGARVTEVMEACRAAGVTQISLSVRDPEATAAGAASAPRVASGPSSTPPMPAVAEAVAETHALATRTFRIDPHTLAAGLDAVVGRGQTNLTAQQQLRRLLTAGGLDFPEAGSQSTNKLLARSFFYNESNGMLLVRAAPAELGAVEQLLQVLNVAPPQVVIEAKFVEITTGPNVSLGFDWFLGNTQVGSNTITGSSVGTTTGVFPGIPGAATNLVAGEGITTGFRGNPQSRDAGSVAGRAGTNVMRELRGDQLAWVGRDATNAANIRVSAAQGVTVTGILTDPQFRAVVRALEQRAGVEVLSAPRVTTLSGRQAQIQVSEFRTVLTGVNPGAMTTRGVTGATNGLPFTSASIPTGPSLDVVPVVSADGATISLTVIPTVTEFLGYDEPPRGSKVEVVVNGKSQRVDPPLPRFRVRQMVTQAVVRDGQTLVLGGFPVEEVRMTKDKVPVLGDIPIAGRLFRHESRSTVRKQLMVLVTATIVDPAGNPLHAVNP